MSPAALMLTLSPACRATDDGADAADSRAISPASKARRGSAVGGAVAREFAEYLRTRLL
ncbi:MAG: hypothetical protein QGG75_00235 [Alphaproteobacteria bacterium]|jgi:hypothetical protein|nr:hypothetical protein [Alphaproteobacteria bacterium]